MCFAVAGGKGIQQIHNVAVANILWLIQSREDFDKIPSLLTCTSYDPSNETRICNFLLKVVYIILYVVALDRVFYEIYKHEHEGEAPRVSCHVYCIKREDFSCYNYVFYITTTPYMYLPCNNNNINRRELYDFYYMAITLTTGYKLLYMCCDYVRAYNYNHTCTVMMYTHFKLYTCTCTFYTVCRGLLTIILSRLSLSKWRSVQEARNALM